MRKTITMRAALDGVFAPILPGASWQTWRALLISSMGEKLNWRERRLFQKVTGRSREPGEMVDHLVCLVGRRGGKSRAASVLAVYLAALCDYSSVAAPGERLRVLFLARNQKQAAVCFSYCAGIFDAVPALADLVINKTQDTISLSSGVDLEIMAASAAGIRGVTCVGIIADEASHWQTDNDSVNGDTVILNAARPSLATTGGPLVIISSVYARRGETFDLWDKHFGPKGDSRILVALGTSRDFNSSLPQSVVDRALERDPAANAAEYLSVWRDDLESFVTLDTIRACTGPLLVREPVPGVAYTAGVDFAGGSGQDSLALAFCHFDESADRVVVDLVHEWEPPFSPSQAIQEVAVLCRHFGIDTLIGDRWGGDFPREAVRQCGLSYRVSDRTTSDCFAALLPLMNSREVELPRHPKALAQIGALQRRPSASGRDKIGHPSNANAHDDMAAAIAVAVAHCAFGTPKAHWCAVNDAGEVYSGDSNIPMAHCQRPNIFEENNFLYW
ncbi:MAG: hypothetical protein ABSG53_07155 [Thermoguttaceae bacterium]|jgi:hypothetical protein